MEIFKLDEVITSLKEYYKREMQKSKETNDEQQKTKCDLAELRNEIYKYILITEIKCN